MILDPVSIPNDITTFLPTLNDFCREDKFNPNLYSICTNGREFACIKNYQVGGQWRKVTNLELIPLCKNIFEEQSKWHIHSNVEHIDAFDKTQTLRWDKKHTLRCIDSRRSDMDSMRYVLKKPENAADNIDKLITKIDDFALFLLDWRNLKNQICHKIEKCYTMSKTIREFLLNIYNELMNDMRFTKANSKEKIEFFSENLESRTIESTGDIYNSKKALKNDFCHDCI